MNFRTLLFAFIIFIAGCGVSEEKSLEKVGDAEAALYGDNSDFKFDEKLAREAIKSYEDFAENHPKSTQAPEMLLKAADLHRALKEHSVAVDIYKKIESDYSDYPKLPHVIFLQGFVYENDLQQLDKAKERYETFLKLYPDHELSDDVTFSLRNLGKTPEEIIKGFETIDSLVVKADSIAS